MTDRPNPVALRPELLAAYVDGELEGAARTEVEAWLAANPQAAAEVREQQRLLQLLEQTLPPPPSETEWQTVRDEIDAGLNRARPASTGRRRARLLLGALATLATAAAVLVMVLKGDHPDPEPALTRSEPDDVPFLVLSADEVRIESMHDADAGAIVVGEPPVRAPLQLLTVADVKVRAMDPDEWGRAPRVHTEEKSGIPMIVMPPMPGTGREP